MARLGGFIVLIMLVGWPLVVKAQDVLITAGFKASITASAVFLAGRNPLDVKRDELHGTLLALEELPEPVVDYEHQAVFVDYTSSKVPRMAVYREGVGTVLTPPGWTLDDLDKLPPASIAPPTGDAARIPWPQGDLVDAAPWPAAVDRDRLEAVVDGAFKPAPGEHHKTLGVVVVHKDRILSERYAPGWGIHVPYRIWSTSKSIMSALIGILVRQNRLSLKDPAPISAWQGADDPRRAITIEQLIHMSSGLQSDGARTWRAYWGGIDTANDIVSKPLEATPGTRWKYANYDTLLLALSMKQVLGGGQAYWRFPREELLFKIGMRHTVPEMDPYGNFIFSSQVYSTPRDLARFGLLYLHDGVWQGERILPKGWVNFTTRPAPADARRRYGAQFWLFGGHPRLPADVYSTAGSRGQFVTICPSRDLVVVRTGLDPMSRRRSWRQAAFVADILDAIGEP